MTKSTTTDKYLSYYTFFDKINHGFSKAIFIRNGPIENCLLFPLFFYNFHYI